MKQRSVLRKLLLPMTPLYRAALAFREFQLRTGDKAARRLKCPVISIGGLSAGGSGKTPLTIALAKALMHRGVQVDVLSRGYGRSSKTALRLDPNGSAEDCGDEPLLIAREAGVAVFVASQRYDAGLLAESMLTDSGLRTVHLLDDGFQHRKLHRDVDILILDSGDLHDHLLPAGDMREPIRALMRARVIAIPTHDSEVESALRTLGWHGPIWHLGRRMDVPHIAGPVVAFCGIARSDQFFDGLVIGGLHVASRVAFVDHHRYIQHDIDCIIGAARSINATAIVTTEKDRVRMGKLAASFPGACPLTTAGLTIEIENESAAVDWILERLR